MPTLQEVYYTKQSKLYSNEQVEQKVNDVCEQIQHDVIKVIHTSNDLEVYDYEKLSESLNQTIRDYFSDEYGV